MKKVTVFSTNVGQGISFETEATTFRELQEDFHNNDVSFSKNSMKAILGTTRTTLESDLALLPETDFNVFLMPKKTKSGQDLSRTECYEKIKDLIEKFGENAKDYFYKYTNMATSRLNELISEFPYAEDVAKPVTEPVQQEGVNQELIEKIGKLEKRISLLEEAMEEVYPEVFGENFETEEKEEDDINPELRDLMEDLDLCC